MDVIINEDSLGPALERVARAFDDKTPLMAQFGEYLIDSTKRRFNEGTAPDGSKWAPKSQATIDMYRARGDRVDFRPLHGPSGQLSEQIHSEVREDSVEWGSRMPYASVMQRGAAQGAFGATSRGAPIPFGNIPARPFLGLSDEDQNALTLLADDWLEGMVKDQH